MINTMSRATAAAGLLVAVGAQAQGETGLAVYNQSALSRAFELPVLGRPSVLAGGSGSTALRYDLTSEYHAEQSETESVILDGEAQMLTLAFQRGFGSGLEWTAELPVIHQSGGFMDGFIEGWHEAFALPDGGRPEAPRDRYLYQYQRDGEVVLQQSRHGTELGDLRLGLGWQAAHWAALRFELKLATGDEDRFSGGNHGGALWFDAALPFAEASRWSGWLAAGASYNGPTEQLAEQQQRFVPFGGFGLGLALNPALSLLGQLYAHGELYEDSGLDPLREALQLALGLRWRVSPDLAVDIGFQEDLVTASSPDLSLHLALAWR